MRARQKYLSTSETRIVVLHNNHGIVRAPPMTLTFDEARHLLSRTGFGGSLDDIRRFMTFDRRAAVAQVLSITTTKARTPPPVWIHGLPPLHHRRARWSEQERKTFHEQLKIQGRELKTWWYRELVTTPNPLLERMTLFWHNHFTSSVHKVRWPAFLYQQNVLLRLHAMESFRTLLHAIARIRPCCSILIQTNRKEHPNENFARELFELFTLGEGHYHEQDIKEAARAFAGWHVDLRTGAFRVDVRHFDDGQKTLFGKTGRFEGRRRIVADAGAASGRPLSHGKLWRVCVR